MPLRGLLLWLRCLLVRLNRLLLLLDGGMEEKLARLLLAVVRSAG